MIPEKQIKSDPMFWYLAVLTVCSTIGLQTWQTLFNNFAVDIAGLDGDHIGVIQSVREIPGFLALLGLIPLTIGLYIWAQRRRQRYAVRYSSLALVREALPRHSRLRRYLPTALFLLARREQWLHRCR